MECSDFGARLYDQSIGRWMCPDPLAEKYYSVSPYVYCMNNPMSCFDMRGDSITTVIQIREEDENGNVRIRHEKYYYGKDSSGKYGFIGSDGKIYSGDNSFIAKLTKAIKNMSKGPVGSALVQELTESTKTVNIGKGEDNGVNEKGDQITWNPESEEGGIDSKGNDKRPSYIGLGHEMAHIQDTWNGTIDKGIWTVTNDGEVIYNSEKYAVSVENKIRIENKIPVRTHYAIEIKDGVKVGLESTRVVF
ncbi:M91 family zinc metallopeptidase [Coprobacter tertius]|uniref:M91 family zinc metallopeptidase n=1 Tax=Coprobacter tertius TaxID=2944915 RepID=A0ABT1MD02_9BACT|nr:M91 family zinc metallopeptidase [Coprobacter tertius]MCP9610510.1 M91 family zinc metallopeptidase [Coprobacter tertius]